MEAGYGGVRLRSEAGYGGVRPLGSRLRWGAPSRKQATVGCQRGGGSKQVKVWAKEVLGVETPPTEAGFPGMNFR